MLIEVFIQTATALFSSNDIEHRPTFTINHSYLSLILSICIINLSHTQKNLAFADA